ncbi:MAG: hypothetical protein ABWZ41_08900 [Burkholderiales bacterium]
MKFTVTVVDPSVSDPLAAVDEALVQSVQNTGAATAVPPAPTSIALATAIARCLVVFMIFPVRADPGESNYGARNAPFLGYGS